MFQKPTGEQPDCEAVTAPDREACDAALALLTPETERGLEAELYFFARQGKEKLDPKLWPVLALPLRIASRAKLTAQAVQKLRRDPLYRQIFLWRVQQAQLKKADSAELATLEAAEIAAALTRIGPAAEKCKNDNLPPSVLGNLKAQAKKKAEMTWLKGHPAGDGDLREGRIAKLQLDLMALNFELNMLWQQGMPPAASMQSPPAE